jgi:hypothetical protein
MPFRGVPGVLETNPETEQVDQMSIFQQNTCLALLYDLAPDAIPNFV